MAERININGAFRSKRLRVLWRGENNTDNQRAVLDRTAVPVRFGYRWKKQQNKYFVRSVRRIRVVVHCRTRVRKLPNDSFLVYAKRLLPDRNFFADRPTEIFVRNFITRVPTMRRTMARWWRNGAGGERGILFSALMFSRFVRHGK